MLFMNEWDIAQAGRKHAAHPVLSRAVAVVDDLRALADRRSDGWAYWQAPVRSARKLIQLINGPPEAATAEALKAALVPIKAFLTRHRDNLDGDTIDTSVAGRSR